MKKGSTVATKQSRDFSRQKLTIGLDLGDRCSCYCALDESGRVVKEQKVATTAKALQAAFGAMPRSRIALETGCDGVLIVLLSLEKRPSWWRPAH